MYSSLFFLLYLSAVDGEEYGRGEGHSRADAKEAAAMNAWLRFRRLHGA